MLESGTIVAGYRIDSFLAQGGMGVVYRATQIGLDRPVALKLIAPELARDPAFRTRFEHESRLAAQIEHPNVIPVYEAGEADGQLFISMRFVDGTDLHAEIDRGPIEPARAARIVEQVGLALDAAHARGLVHRDVKPANVLIGAGDHAYLTDFGLVKDLGSDGRMTSTGMWVGTPDYVAPEQFKGEDVDARTDVYSLGCMLYHALTGEVPFPRSQAVAKMWAHAEEPPPSLEGPIASLDPVIQRAMAKDPADRYPSAGDLGRAAVAAVEGRPVSEGERTVARGEAAPTRESPDDVTAVRERPDATERSGGGRRRALIAGAAAVAALLVIAGVVLALSSGGDDPSGARKGTDPDLARATGPVVQSQAKIGGDLRAVGAGGGSVFTMDQDGRVVQVDAKTGKFRSDTQLEKIGGDVTYGFGAFWATSRARKEGAGELERIDAKTGIQSGHPVRVGKRPLGVTAGDKVLWVANASSNNVMHVDPRAMKVVGKPVEVEDGPFGIAADRTAVWVTQFGDGTEKNRGGGLVRIDPPIDPLDPGSDANLFGKTVEVGDNAQSVAFGGPYVWAVGGFGSLLRFDPKSNQEFRTGVGDFGGMTAVVGDGKNVWVAGTKFGADRMQVARLDLQTAKPIGKPAPIGPAGGGRIADLALADGVLWASTGDTLYKLKP